MSITGKKTKSFDVDNYSVSLSLNDESIYFQITNRNSFLCYEANVDESNFCFPCFPLNTLYLFVCDCFAFKGGHSVEILLTSGAVKLIMYVTIGHLHFRTELVLREQERPPYSKLSEKLTRMEQRLEELHRESRELQEESKVVIQKNQELNKRNQILENIVLELKKERKAEDTGFTPLNEQIRVLKLKNHDLDKRNIWIANELERMEIHLKSLGLPMLPASRSYFEFVK
jgi:hypothetical protein